ncbi:MAG: nitroreductase [Bacteroidaceae bacterium]|nr:nitroreductase [Bacteroidaceae bacterium]
MNNIIKKIAGAGVVAAALGACTPQAQPAEDKCCENAQGTACNPVIETIMTRRSIRKYKDNPVGRDTMQVILECGINAPNALNKQSWEVRVVDNPEFINGITELFKQKNPKATEGPAFKNMFRNAPTVAFVAQDAAFPFSKIDCGLMGENMMLSAWSMGIGSCCLGGPVHFINNEPEAKPYLDRLGFSEGYELIYCIAFGYPDETPDAKPRKKEKVMFVE